MFHSLVVPRIYLLTTLAVKLERVPPERAGAVQICSPVVDDQKNDDGIRQEVVMVSLQEDKLSDQATLRSVCQ